MENEHSVHWGAHMYYEHWIHQQRTCASKKSNNAGKGSLTRKRRWKRVPFGSLIRQAVVADSSAGGSGGSEAPFSCTAMLPLSMQVRHNGFKTLNCCSIYKAGRLSPLAGT